jgi:hypothetical protein
MNDKPDNLSPAYPGGSAVPDSDLAALKKAMVKAHPDRGGTDEAFIKARKAYLAAKWLRKEDRVAAQGRWREETEVADEEKRRREAADAMARFRGRAALAICAYAAALLVFAAVARHKEHPVTADAGRPRNLAATITPPTPQLVPSNPYEAALSDSPKTPTESASANELPPAATAAVPDDSSRKGDSLREEEADAAIRPAATKPSTPEQQAKFIVNAAMDATNTGNIDGTSNCYADTVTYYGKRMSRSDVIADNRKLWERWPTRNYAIRPDSLTASCYVIYRERMWMNCNVKGVFDWEATNSSKRSVGSASITYTLMGLSNTDPLDLRIVDENSTVMTRTITDIGKQRARQTAAPG